MRETNKLRHDTRLKPSVWGKNRQGGSKNGSAYVFVLVIMLLLFLMLSFTLQLTSFSQRVTAHDLQYAGLYDLAVGGNEQAFSLACAAVNEHRSDIDARVREEIIQADLYSHLVYRNRQFHLSAATNGKQAEEYYASLFKAYADDVIMNCLSQTFTPSQGRYIFTWGLSVPFPLQKDAEGADTVTEAYSARTTVEKHSTGYTVKTAVSKMNQGQESYPIEVEAEWIWPDIDHEEWLIPGYTWREMPEAFGYALYASGEIYLMDNTPAGSETTLAYLEVDPSAPVMPNAPPLSDSTDLSLLPALSLYDEPALLVNTASSLDVSLLYDNGIPIPTALIHTGGPLKLYASDINRNRFAGIAVCLEDLTLDGVAVSGTALCGGDLRLTTPVPEVDTHILFRIGLSMKAQQDFFDFLKLTKFSSVSTPTTDIEKIIGGLSFDLTGENGTPCRIEINNFDDAALAMVKLKQITEE